MYHGELANTVCMINSLVCLETFNLLMNSPNIIKSEWMFVKSNQTTVGDKINVRKYYGIIQ